MGFKHQYLHDAAKRDVTTIDGQVVSVVFVTAEPTFTGVIGGYTTDDGSQATDDVDFSSATAVASSSPSADPFSYDLNTLTGANAPTTTANTRAALPTSDQNSVASSSASYSYGSSTRSAVNANPTSADSDASTSASSSSTSDAGLSTAGKAGLAIGIILAIGAVLALLLFLLGKKKRQVKAEQARQDSEKNAAIAATKAQPVSAPRLSLRPASSFLPEFMGGARPKSRLSQGNMLGGTNNEPNATREKYLAAPGSQNIPMTAKNAPAENPFKDPENPFADPVKPAPVPVQMPEPAPKPAPLQMPMSEESPAPATIPMPEPKFSPNSEQIAAVAASAGAVAAAQAAMRHNHPPSRPEPARNEPIEMPSPPVHIPAPLATPKSITSNASSGPAGTPDGQVYRILMDFVPSMEDELELKAGQVVRMLHEYDDGWCLCARLDRSQQGVVPRTCLAAKPSKPRPGPGPNQGRPMGPNMRNGPPRPMSPGQGRPMSPGMGNRAMSPGPQGRPPMGPGPQGRPMSPAQNRQANGMRPMSPGAYNQAPRPLSPGPRASQQSRRAQSPGPYGHAGGPKPMAPNQRRRSNSSSAAARDVRDRRASPPGPSPLGGFAPGMAI